MKVVDPEGRTWRVTRRWLPWRPRRRMMDPDLIADGADDPIGCLVMLVLGLVVLPLLSIVVILAAEMLLLLLLLPFVVTARMAFGRKWWVEARLGYRAHAEEEVGSWRASAHRIREIASAIERGDPPLQTLGSKLTGPLPPTPYDPPREGA
jgi:hypothetical protein